jgi:hypothetical protein
MVNNGQFSGDEKLKSQVLEIGKKSAKIVDDIKKISPVLSPEPFCSDAFSFALISAKVAIIVLLY